MSERIDRSQPIENNKPKELGLSTFGFSIPSAKHPETNEDTIAHSPTDTYAMVLDGVGGQERGDAASQAAVSTLTRRLAIVPEVDNSYSFSDTKSAIGSSLYEASEAARAATQAKGGSTATVVKIVRAWDHISEEPVRAAVFGNVGDSRLYLLRDGKLNQVTIDHSPLQDVEKSPEELKAIAAQLDEVSSEEDLKALPHIRIGDVMSEDDLSRYLDHGDKERGIPDEKLEDVINMGMYQYLYRKSNYINQSLGRRNVEPQIGVIRVRPGDKLILTSDGVHDNLKRSEIEAILQAIPIDPAQALVEAAKKRSEDKDHLRSKADDISAVVVNIGEVNNDDIKQEDDIPAFSFNPDEEDDFSVSRQSWAYEPGEDPLEDPDLATEVALKSRIGRVWNQPGQTVAFSVFPREHDTQVYGVSIHEVYFRTESGNIYRVDSSGSLVDARSSRNQRRLKPRKLPIDEQGYIDGRVTIGQPFVSGSLETTKVTEIVTTSEEIHNTRMLTSEQRELLKEGPRNTIIDEFENLLQ